MLVVISLGGNALVERGQLITARIQRENIRRAIGPIAQIVSAGHRIVLSHGNGPQIGLLALQSAAYRPSAQEPLDVLGAETEGAIGYMIEQELEDVLGPSAPVAALLTCVEVDCDDPAFVNPTKPIGPLYERAEAEDLRRQRGWSVAPDGDKYRRVVASPMPKRVLEIAVIRLLVTHGVIPICAGGGGVPVVRTSRGGMIGVEAVIDKDRASALLARELDADFLLLLTDVDAVYDRWGTPQKAPIRRTTPALLKDRQFAAGSMQPKVEAACAYVVNTRRPAGIGRLADALSILRGDSGTLIAADEKACGSAFSDHA
jgi:carbamate kinase